MAGLFATLLGADAGTPAMPPDDDRWYGGGAGVQSFTGRRVTPDLAMRVSTVYACVNLLARTVASLPLLMYRTGQGGTFEAPEHPLYDVLEHQPNRWQTAFDFRAMMMTHLCMRGNAYAEIVPGPRGAVDQLEPLHPDRVIPQRLPDGSIRYQLSDGRRLLQDEMLHIRSSNAPDGLVGVGSIAYARETIGLAMATEEHGARMFSNGARPSGVVQLKKTLGEAAFQRFKQEWRSAYHGLSKSGGTPILEEGAEFKPISMTADELQFLGTRRFQIEEIARWFDVPLVMLHHMTDQTSWGTGVEAIMLAFVRNNLRPWLRAWEQAIRRDLILVPNVYSARFDTEALQRGDSKALADYISRLVLNGVLTRNEGRLMLGYNPLPGLDTPLTPTNTSTSDRLPGNGGGASALVGHNGGPPLDDAPPAGVPAA